MIVDKQGYLGFTYNGKHSSEFNIIRVSDGSRFNENLLPTIQDKTIPVPGVSGKIFQRADYDTRVFSISVAYDNMSEQDIRNMRGWLGDKKIHKLVFDELPYKTWYAKVTGTASMKWLPFNEGESNRLYKGEGTIQFTCYEPFAHCSNKWFELEDGFNWETFEDEEKTNQWREWVYSSGLLDTYKKNTTIKEGLKLDRDGNLITSDGTKFETLLANGLLKLLKDKTLVLKEGLLSYPVSVDSEWIPIYNCGDVPTDFKLTIKFNNGIIPQGGLYLGEVDENDNVTILEAITWKEIPSMNNTETGIVINSRMNLLEGARWDVNIEDSLAIKTGFIYDEHITSGTYFQLPCGKSVLGFFLLNEKGETISTSSYIQDLEFDYLYL